MKRPLEEHEFQERFSRVTHGPYGQQVVGSRNTDQLRDMIAPGFIRRTKLEVLRDLPPIRYVTTPISLGRADLPGPWNGDRLAAVPDADLLHHLESMASDPLLPLASARRELGLRKVKPVIAWLEAWQADSTPGSKLLLFAIHRDVIDALYLLLLDLRRTVPNIVKIDGRTPPAERTAAVELFQHDPECLLFLGQIQAAGESITLTAASTVAIMEAEFVPARIAQAAARAHRIGQHSAVLVHLLSVPDSLDIRVNRIAARKAAELVGLFVETEETIEGSAR